MIKPSMTKPPVMHVRSRAMVRRGLPACAAVTDH